ncbi:MAG: hypothetical protein R2695_03350 [Acidimicrobiales bacterium]
MWQRTYSVADISRWLNAYVDPVSGDQLHVGTVKRISISNVPKSGRINFARVTIHGSKKTVQVVDGSGDPYGYRFFVALRQGCLVDDGKSGVDCDPSSRRSSRSARSATWTSAPTTTSPCSG